MDELEQLLARVRQSAFVDLSVFDERRPTLRMPGGKHRLVRRIEEHYDADQIAWLLDLLDGRAVLLAVRGELYAAKSAGGTVRIRSVAKGEPTHTVVDGACSCEDAKFRGRKCKHLVAVEGMP